MGRCGLKVPNILSTYNIMEISGPNLAQTTGLRGYGMVAMFHKHSKHVSWHFNSMFCLFRIFYKNCMIHPKAHRALKIGKLLWYHHRISPYPLNCDNVYESLYNSHCIKITMHFKTEQAYIPIEKIIRTSLQCNTSGNRHQPATYGDLCLKWKHIIKVHRSVCGNALNCDLGHYSSL